jgi:hypothetical protein
MINSGVPYTMFMMGFNNNNLYYSLFFLANNGSVQSVSASSTAVATVYKYAIPISTSNTLIPADVSMYLESNICFVKGTLVSTDQGDVAIEELDCSLHTLNGGERIVGVTRTIYNCTRLVRICKGVFDLDVPNKDTIMSPDHCIWVDGNMIEAKCFVGVLEGVDFVQYRGGILYNVLLETHGTMTVHNMSVETLHPQNFIALLYFQKGLESYQSLIVEELNCTPRHRRNRKRMLIAQWMQTIINTANANTKCD